MSATVHCLSRRHLHPRAPIKMTRPSCCNPIHPPVERLWDDIALSGTRSALLTFFSSCARACVLDTSLLRPHCTFALPRPHRLLALPCHHRLLRSRPPALTRAPPRAVFHSMANLCCAVCAFFFFFFHLITDWFPSYSCTVYSSMSLPVFSSALPHVHALAVHVPALPASVPVSSTCRALTAPSPSRASVVDITKTDMSPREKLERANEELGFAPPLIRSTTSSTRLSQVPIPRRETQRTGSFSCSRRSTRNKAAVIRFR